MVGTGLDWTTWEYDQPCHGCLVVVDLKYPNNRPRFLNLGFGGGSGGDGGGDGVGCGRIRSSPSCFSEGNPSLGHHQRGLGHLFPLLDPVCPLHRLRSENPITVLARVGGGVLSPRLTFLGSVQNRVGEGRSPASLSPSTSPSVAEAFHPPSARRTIVAEAEQL